jgi:two-component system OmpR family sensor kinase
VLPELSELAGGLPVAASFAMATGISALREGRRRTSLNEVIHELRRPLQGLALSLPAEGCKGESAESCLRLAVAAVERLDREVNGGAAPAPAESVSLRPVVESAVERWRGLAGALNRSISLTWKASECLLQTEQVELEQALDNLISNALVHGSGPVAVEVVEGGDHLRLAVQDAGCAEVRRDPGMRFHIRRIAGRYRHGHGLRIVRRVAARFGGGFRLRRSPSGTEACLELPLAEASR